ncbi:TetR/AcrR family transcriptional regulator [Neorhizobium sp. NCHU2750]|uniref:TetR/AcrR family transcriptional regulator n=1 Tax=Neorhizobium sp. NCHU2750 TaxID=1825976 RepID=UPI000E75A18C|nr:TetR family transcriptional regulator [Neorhizobium sp. NCHU2750]
MRKPRQKAEDTREDILTAAENLLRENGAARFSIANVATSLGMSPANVFKHFSSKPVLIDAICNRHVMQMIARFECSRAKAPPSQGLGLAVRQLMDVHLADIRENRHLFEMLMQMSLSDLPSGRLYKQRIDDLFTGLINDGVQAGIYHCRTDQIFAHIVGLAFAAILHPILLMYAEEDELVARCDGLVELIETALRG